MASIHVAADMLYIEFTDALMLLFIIGLETLPHVTISLTISLTMPVVSIVDDGIKR